METNVWSQLSALVAAIASLLSKLSPNQPNQSSGGESQSALVKGADSISTSSSATILTIIRNQITEDGVFGEMSVNGGKICFTMENRALLIPAGVYGLEIYDSPHAGHPVPLLQNVIGRSEIEIHCGNTPEDSKGCIIVGLDHKGDTLERSRDAFAGLFPRVQSAVIAGGISVQISDSF